MSNPKVLIEVHGGLAYYKTKGNVDVVLVDWDAVKDCGYKLDDEELAALVEFESLTEEQAEFYRQDRKEE